MEPRAIFWSTFVILNTGILSSTMMLGRGFDRWPKWTVAAWLSLSASLACSVIKFFQWTHPTYYHLWKTWNRASFIIAFIAPGLFFLGFCILAWVWWLSLLQARRRT